MIWFWSFIAHWCPESIQQKNCLSCGENWVNTCAADQYSCYLSYDVTVPGGYSLEHENRTCPYQICRYGFLSYFIARMNIFVWCVLALVMLTFLAVVCTLMLFCFNKRDTVEEMMRKSGAIKKKPTDPNATATVVGVGDHKGGVELMDKNKKNAAPASVGVQAGANKATMQVASNVPKVASPAAVVKAPVLNPAPGNQLKAAPVPVVANSPPAKANTAVVTTQPVSSTATTAAVAVPRAPTASTSAPKPPVPPAAGAKAQPQKKMVNIGAFVEQQNATKKKGWFS